jgi:acyl transferase domain-containing protein
MNGAEATHLESEIAIIGMSGRFPGAGNVSAFWDNLLGGVETITTFTDEELIAAGEDPQAINHPDYVKARGVLENIEMFDAAFFGFTRREAEIMDPQQRMFLECAWEALEDAGYDSETYEGAVGVFAGVSVSRYLFNLYSHPDLLKSVGHYQAVLGNDKDFLATRVSYKLNLKGPSVVVQTACSTSMVAVHMACQSLLLRECDMALAGAAAVKGLKKTGYVYHEGGITSPDGHCRAFDERAQGTVDSDGIGVVTLKRLTDALTDGDQIYAIIKSSAINNDGSLKVGYTAPSVEGQARAIVEAIALAEVEAEALTYVEAHGTGTPLGDPVEITALTKAFRESTQKKNFCAIASVKSNIGHLDTAAGVAGLIKTALALKHKMLPPSLHFTNPNPKIDFENSPFYVNSKLTEWKTDQTPRLAGVSSFGIGGTNAHVVLEEAPATGAPGKSRPWHLLMLSAKTATALDAATERLAEHLKQHPELNIADVAYTLQRGRRSFSQRRTVLCRDAAEAVAALQTPDPRRLQAHPKPPASPPVVFMFPGQGTQYVNMALELYGAEPLFLEQVDLCAELLKARLGLDLRDVLYPKEEAGAEETAAQLDQTALAQPALFVVEYALARLWTEWVGEPQAMIGHSIGEYVAACLAGVFSLEAALTLVAGRGRLMQNMPSGAMLAVALSEAELEPLLDERLSLAAVNGHARSVVAGTNEAVEELQGRLAARGINSRPLRTSHAFHSGMMEPVLEPFTELVAHTALRPPTIPYISNVTGTWITAAEATDPGYWAQHLRRTVRFADGLSIFLKEKGWALLEVGPGQTLSAMVNQHPDKEAGQVVLSSLGGAQAGQPEMASVLSALGQLWAVGRQINWPRFYAQEQRRRVSLPTYAFDRQRCWIDAPVAASRAAASGESAVPGEMNRPHPPLDEMPPAPVAPEETGATIETSALEETAAPIGTSAPVETSAPQQAAVTLPRAEIEPPHVSHAGEPARSESWSAARVSEQAVGGLEQVLSQQLEIMSQQLAILGGGFAPDLISTTAESLISPEASRDDGQP